MWRDLLQAEGHLGHTNGLRLLVSNLAAVLEADIDEDLAPETGELIRQLLPRSQAS